MRQPGRQHTNQDMPQRWQPIKEDPKSKDCPVASVRGKTESCLHVGQFKVKDDILLLCWQKGIRIDDNNRTAIHSTLN